MKFEPLYPTLPAKARAELDEMIDALRPLSWPERSAAFEGLWDAVHAHHLKNAATLPAGTSPATEWRVRLTIALERLWNGQVKHADHAAWAALSFHPLWQRRARQFMRRTGDPFTAWSADHPGFLVIAEAISLQVPQPIAAVTMH